MSWTLSVFSPTEWLERDLSFVQALAVEFEKVEDPFSNTKVGLSIRQNWYSPVLETRLGVERGRLCRWCVSGERSLRLWPEVWMVWRHSSASSPANTKVSKVTPKG